MPRPALLSLLFLFCWGLPAAAGDLTVFAASSLTDALTEVVQRYQLQNPQDRVLLNFAGSQTLATQIEQGAPAELFISANHSVMARLQKSNLATDIHPLLGNRLVVATRPDLQPPLEKIRDLGRPGLLLVIGNPHVPIGSYTHRFLSRLAESPRFGAALVTQIKANIVSEEGRVKAVVAKLLLGEADAGIIYQSDLAGSQLRAVEIPEELNPRAVYPLAKINGGSSGSAKLYAFLRGREAAEIFQRYGFLAGGEL